MSEMESLLQRFTTRRRLIVRGYWAFIGLIVVVVTGYLTGVWGLAILPEPSEEPDLIAGVLSFVGFGLGIHWCALFGTGTLSDTGFLHALGKRIRIGYLRNRPRLLAVARWSLAVPALAFQFTLQGIGLTMCYLVLAARIGSNVIEERNLAGGFLGELDLAAILFFIVGPLALILFTVLAYRFERLPALLYSHAIIAGLSFYTMVVLAITLYLRLEVFRGDDDEILLILILPASQFTLSLGSLIRLGLGRTSPPLCQPKPTALREPISGFSGRSSLSSARFLAMALLVVSYIAIDVSLEHAGDMGKLQEARTLLAAQASDELDGITPQAEVNSIERAPLGHLSRVQKRTTGFLSFKPEIIRLTMYDGRTWFASPVSTSTDDLEQELIGRLERLARQLDVSHDEGDDLYELFFRVESQILGNKLVSMPVVGIPVEAGRAAWVLVVTNLLALILIRSRIRRVFADHQYAREEPWLILDGRAGLERYAAYLWLVMLMASVWITHVSLLITLGAQIPAQGGVTTLFGDLLRLGAALPIFVLSVWVGHDTNRLLFTLRRIRREEFTQKEPGSENDGSP